MISSHDHRRRGFTLIELLVALSVLGLLTGVGFALARVGARSWEKANRVSSQLERVEAVQTLLRQQLSTIQPLFIASGDEAQVKFRGEANSLYFHGVLPAALGARGTAEIHLKLEQGSPAGTLIMAWRATPSSSWRQTTLLTGLQGGRWSYLGHDDQGKSTWTDVWSGKSLLPHAIRLDIGFADGMAQSWPVLVVRPQVTGDLYCRSKTDAQECSTP